jgi:hypothetical protein
MKRQSPIDSKLILSRLFLSSVAKDRRLGRKDVRHVRSSVHIKLDTGEGYKLYKRI